MPQKINLKGFCDNLCNYIYHIFIPIFSLKFQFRSSDRSPATVTQDPETNVWYDVKT